MRVIYNWEIHRITEKCSLMNGDDVKGFSKVQVLARNCIFVRFPVLAAFPVGIFFISFMHVMDLLPET